MTRRVRGLGSVYQRGGTYWIKFYVDGKAKRESAHSEKEAVAVRLLKRRLEELSAGRYVPDAGKVTLGELLTMLGVDATAKGNRSRPPGLGKLGGQAALDHRRRAAQRRELLACRQDGHATRKHRVSRDRGGCCGASRTAHPGPRSRRAWAQVGHRAVDLSTIGGAQGITNPLRPHWRLAR